MCSSRLRGPCACAPLLIYVRASNCAACQQLDGNGVLDPEEVSKLLTMAAAPTSVLAEKAAKKAENTQVKHVTTLKTAAEASQREAHLALKKAEAEATAAEALVAERRAKAAAAAARAKKDELADFKKKQKSSNNTVAKFMQIDNATGGANGK